jgi:predicted RNase H-like HicB family nuclease
MALMDRAATRTFVVHAHWDEDAAVWVAESDDVPGLATEADTTEALFRKLEVVIPELLEANGLSAPEPVPFQLLAERRGLVSRP